MTGTGAFVAKQIVNGVYSVSKRKGKSFIWNILSDILKEDDTILEGYVYCRACRRVLKFTSHQTSNLNRHKCCQALKNPPALQVVTGVDKEAAIETLTEWIIEDCQSISSIERSGFANMAKYFIKLGAAYGESVDIKDLMPDATTISQEIQREADKKREFISNHIKEAVSSGSATATVDILLNNYIKRHFLVVTLHYQKNYQLFDIILGVKSLDFECSNGNNIFKKLCTLFNQFGVEYLYTINFVTSRNKNIEYGLKYNTRVNCSRDLLADVLDRSFSETKLLKEIILACKRVINYFKKFNIQHNIPTTLGYSNPTRWRSDYTILKSVVDNWAIVNEVFNESEETKTLLKINMTTLKILVEFCKIFDIVFKKLQVCSSPSLCFVLPSIYRIKSLCEFNPSDIPLMIELKKNIIKNVDKIWVNNLSIWHKVAFFLYPPAVNMQIINRNEIKEFCVSQIETNDNSEKPSTSTSNTQETIPIKTESANDPLMDVNVVQPFENNAITSSTLEQTLSVKTESPNDPLMDVTEYSINEVQLNENNAISSSTLEVKTESPNEFMELNEYSITEVQPFENNAISSSTIEQTIRVKSEPSSRASSPSSPLTSTNLNSMKNFCITNVQTISESSPRQDIQFFFPNLLQKSEQKSTLQTKQTPTEELEKYCKETVELTEEFDLLQWWKNNEKKYPNLSKLAIKVHTIPASCAAADFAFSLTGHLITEKRNRLAPKALSDTLFLHSYHKSFEK